MEAIVFIILQMFYTTRAALKIGIFNTYIQQLSCDIARNIVWYLADEEVGRVD